MSDNGKDLGAHILGVEDRGYVELDVPEWGCRVRIGTLTGAERDALEASGIRVVNGKVKVVDKSGMRARLAAYVLQDLEGNRLFTEADIPKLAKKSAKALERINVAASELNGLTDAEAEELEKNLRAALSGGSGDD